jgi:hypothetical protein
MSSLTPRIVVIAGRGDGHAIDSALKECERLSGRLIILLVPTKAHLRIPALQSALGADAVKSLENGDSVRLPGGSDLRVATPRKTDEISARVVILAVYPDRKVLDILDRPIQPSGIVVVIHDPADIREWIRTWNPDILGRPREAEDPLFHDQSVKNALDTFRKRATVGGRLHPLDRTAAIQMLRDLRHKGLSVDPLALRAWALRRGWAVAGADQFKELAEGAHEGRRFRTQ